MTTNYPPKRLRLLRLVVQPTYVLDDGEHLIEQTGEPFVVQPSEVAAFSEKWASDFAELSRRLQADSDQPLPPA